MLFWIDPLMGGVQGRASTRQVHKIKEVVASLGAAFFRVRGMAGVTIRKDFPVRAASHFTWRVTR